MKKSFYILFIQLITISGFAQISVGVSTPHSSAILDLDVSTLTPKKGFLMPRVNLTGNNDAATIPSPINGLMAYNLTQANSGVNLIKGNTVGIWSGGKWQKFTDLAEIKSLKLPIEFVLSSKTQQIYNASNLTTINANQPLPIAWTAADIYIANDADVEYQSGSQSLKILTTSYYDFSGMINFRANVAVSGSSSHVIAVIQKSTDEGGTWTDFMASSMPLEQFATNRTYTITLPNCIHLLNKDEWIRVVVKKPNYTTATNYSTNSGIVVSNAGTDITKSLRIVRLQQ